MLNYNLSQKLKLRGRDKFNHIINILALPLTCGLKLHFLIVEAQHVECLIKMGMNNWNKVRTQYLLLWYHIKLAFIPIA